MKTWIYYLIQSVLVVLCISVLTSCSDIPQVISDADVNPWELAHKQCSKLDDLDAAKCHLGVAIARDACNHGVDRVECEGAVDPTVCRTVNDSLKALCEKGGDNTPLEWM